MFFLQKKFTTNIKIYVKTKCRYWISVTINPIHVFISNHFSYIYFFAGVSSIDMTGIETFLELGRILDSKGIKVKNLKHAYVMVFRIVFWTYEGNLCVVIAVKYCEP